MLSLQDIYTSNICNNIVPMLRYRDREREKNASYYMKTPKIQVEESKDSHQTHRQTTSTQFPLMQNLTHCYRSSHMTCEV